MARVFGGHGYRVGLIARGSENLDKLVGRLAESGVTAEGFAADVSDLPALTAALGRASDRFGAIDVLEYSPYSGLTMVDPPDVTVENLQPALEHLLYGAVAATQAVLPGMLAAGRGTLLYTTGGGAINPYRCSPP